MKLQQLRYIVEVVNHHLNVSATAESLYTSQPGISKQIKLLEDELGVQIFARAGKQLIHLTPIGEQIVTLAREVLAKTTAIKVMAQEVSQPNSGSLSIITTYTQARHALPQVIQQVIHKYPKLSLRLEQGSGKQLVDAVSSGQCDFAITSELPKVNDDTLVLPCYHWNYAVVVPKSHPLTECNVLTLHELAKYPLISYDFSTEGGDLNKAFHRENLAPNIVFSSEDADLIKTYVKLGMGVGIVAKMAINELDSDLVMLNVGHLFSYNTTYLIFLRTLFLRQYMYDFIQQFSNHLNRSLIDRAIAGNSNTEILAMFNGVKLPVR